MCLHNNADNSFVFVNGKEIFKFKANNKNVNFSAQFYFENISNGFSAIESEKVFWNGKVYDFLDDYGYIDKSGILNIH